jgi:hypothetical protein
MTADACSCWIPDPLMNNKHEHTFKVSPNLIIVSNESSSFLGSSSDVWSTAYLMNDILDMLRESLFKILKKI